MGHGMEVVVTGSRGVSIVVEWGRGIIMDLDEVDKLKER